MLRLYYLEGIQFSSVQFSSVQFSHSVMSDSLRPHESQHARPSCPSPTPGVYPNPCLPSQWCHPAISSSVVPFSSCPQSLPAAAAKLLQSCLTLCDSIDGSPPGSAVPGILQARTLGWGAIAFSDPSQHQGLFQWVNCSHEVAKVLEFQLQHQKALGIPTWKTGFLLQRAEIIEGAGQSHQQCHTVWLRVMTENTTRA